VNHSKKLGETMNSKAMTQGRTVLLILALIVGIVYYTNNMASGTPAPAANPGVVPNTAYVPPSITLTMKANDLANAGTTLGTSLNKVSVNGASYQTGITSVSTGDKLGILFVNNTGYHNGFIGYSPAIAGSIEYVVGQSNPTITSQGLNKNASVTLTVLTTTGTAQMTNNGGAINQTAGGGNGYTYNFPLQMTGSDRASTQDLNCIMESNSTNANKIILSFSSSGMTSTLVGTGKPAFYSALGTASKFWNYKVSPLSTANTVAGTIQVAANSGQSLANSRFVMDCKSYEYFQDTNDPTGAVKYDFQDINGNLKSLPNTIKFTGYIKN